MLSWLLSEAWILLVAGFCYLLLIWTAWWIIRDSVRKVVRDELEKESRDWKAELVDLYGFLQRDESDDRDENERSPGLMSRIRDVVREELAEHARLGGKKTIP